MSFIKFSRLTAVGVAGLLLTVSLTGCGGSGHSQPTVTRSAPTDATRARVQSLYGQSIQSNLYSGAQTLEMAQASGGGASSSDGGAGSSTPYIGAFFRQKALQHTAASRSRQEDVDSNFHYDYYLGLWVETTYTSAKSTYNLYADEAKTQPAGHITTENPADYEAFPQIYRSSYEFTDGLLKGAHGSSLTTTKSDYSGSSTYEDVYTDGGKSAGASSWTSGGDSTYKSREELADGNWTESVGTFRSNGSGGTRYSASDGYSAEYTFNADGTGRGKIVGNDPGLPATIVWNDNGTTITYADGSKEHFDYGFGYGYAVDDMGDGVTTDVPPATPAANPE